MEDKYIIQKLLINHETWKLFCHEVITPIYHVEPDEMALEDFMREYARFTLECHQEAKRTEVHLVCERLETLYESGEKQLVIDMLQAIHSDWENNAVKSEKVKRYLGKKLIRLWEEYVANDTQQFLHNIEKE
jgi:hypothetical protein